MSWCHRLIAHDWLLSVCRPHPATSSTFVFDRFYGYCASRQCSRITRVSPLFRSLALPIALFFSLSFFLSILSCTSVLFMATRDIHSRLVPFVLGSMPQLTSGGWEREEKKSDGTTGNCVHTRGGERRRHGLTDLLRRLRTDASARRVSFLRFSPARPRTPTTLSKRNPRPSS